ncbi:MAG: heliorhodopsin HeR [Patescibacteria group bacterium]|mgnify:CR=1 FL=1
MDIALTPQQHKIKKLRQFNGLMALLHFGQGLAMLMASSSFALPLTTAYVEFNQQSQLLEPVLKTIANLQIGPLVAGFLFLSAFAHFCLAFLPTVRVWYEANLKKGMNIARWVEYSLSSSLMIVVVVMLTGMYDLTSLMLVFFLNMMMILFGWVMEVHNQTTKKTDWTSYIFGCIAGLVPWIAVALYLFNAGEGEFKAPTFVYWIFFSIFVFFNVFAINMILQYKKIGKWKDYLYGERAYIILSLVAKSLLAWQVFAGTLRPV